jgi:hypothetical protein
MQLVHDTHRVRGLYVTHGMRVMLRAHVMHDVRVSRAVQT